MNRKRKAKKKPPQLHAIATDAEKGFDFGEPLAVAASPSTSFEEALREARVFGCAYGSDDVHGLGRGVPCVTLIGENAEGFRRAFAQFVDWGCEADGDVVGVSLLLRLNGTYEVWVGPEPERSMYRLVPHLDLCEPLLVGVSWVKRIDSTNPLVRELQEYRRAPISPVVIGVATADAQNFRPECIEPLGGLPRLVKFELEIVDQAENREDPRFHPRERPAGPTQRKQSGLPDAAHYLRRRTQALDVAFPISRERVRRRGLLAGVRAVPGFDTVCEDQVVQAAVNLTLSHELVPGDRHYRALVSDFPRRIWEHVLSRVEVADGQTAPADQPPVLVARQIELDVRHVLAQCGETGAGGPFGPLQAVFRGRGFIDG